MNTSVVYINIHRTRFSNEIDHEKQNKSRVQKERTATETRPSLSPLIQHTKWFLNLKRVRTSKGMIVLTSHNCKVNPVRPILKYFDLCKL